MTTEAGEARSRRILVVSPFVPSAEAGHGAARVIAGWLTEMSEHRHVGLVHVKGPDERPIDRALAQRLDIVRQVDRATLPNEWRRLRLVYGLLNGVPQWVQAWPMPQVKRAVDEVIADWAPTVVQIEMGVLAPVVTHLRAGAPATVFVVHEPSGSAPPTEADRRGARRILHGLDRRATRRVERTALAHADAVVAFTRTDAEVIAPTANTHVIPFGTDIPQAAARPAAHWPPEVVFVGASGHPPNVSAVRRLVDRVIPRVVLRNDDARFVVVGDWGVEARPHHHCPGRRCDHVRFTGRVDDVGIFLRRAAVFVAPVDEGGGMRVKVIEALAAGCAVVGTPLAFEGIALDEAEEQVAVVAESDADIAAAVVRLLAHPAARIALGAAARSWARGRLGWPACIDDHLELHESLIDAGRTARVR